MPSRKDNVRSRELSGRWPCASQNTRNPVTAKDEPYSSLPFSSQQAHKLSQEARDNAELSFDLSLEDMDMLSQKAREAQHQAIREKCGKGLSKDIFVPTEQHRLRKEHNIEYPDFRKALEDFIAVARTFAKDHSEAVHPCCRSIFRDFPNNERLPELLEPNFTPGGQAFFVEQFRCQHQQVGNLDLPLIW